LCKECHFEKTRAEQDEGYVKTSDTLSSFNSITKEILNSKLNSKYAIITENIPSKYEKYNYIRS